MLRLRPWQQLFHCYRRCHYCHGLLCCFYRYLVVHDGVDEDGDAVLSEDLLWRDLVGGRPHVDLLVDVHTGDDEEHPGTSGAS